MYRIVCHVHVIHVCCVSQHAYMYYMYNVCVLYSCLFAADINGKLHEVMKEDVIEFSDDGQYIQWLHTCTCDYYRIWDFSVSLTFFLFILFLHKFNINAHIE